MILEVKTTINEGVLKTMSRYQLIELKKKSFIFITIMLIIGIASSIYALINYEEKTAYIFILVLLPILYLFLFVVSPFLSAKAALKRLKTSKEDVLQYVYNFHDDHFDIDFYYNDVSKANNNFKYDEVYRVVDYKNYVYLLMKENFVFVINRNDNDEETINRVKDHIINKIIEANSIIQEDKPE